MKISNFKHVGLKKSGQTLVELILVMGIAALVLPALLTGFIASKNGKPQQQQRLQAVAVLKESEAAVRNIKNSKWSALTTNGTYHTVISGAQWGLASNSFINSEGIKQEIIITDVLRDSSGAIVITGGTVDPSTKKVDIKISWTLPYNSTVNSTLYLTRTNNQIFTHTTQADFNAGISAGSEVVSTGGSPTDGQVQLAASGGGNGSGGGGGGPLSDWCAPNLSITALDLPKSGVANAISAIEGRVFAGTGENSAGVSFANISITNTNPPNSSITGTFNGFKTNGVFGESNYGYLATDTNSREIVIVDFTVSPYSEIGYFDAPGNGSGNSIYVSGSIGYMTSGNKLYTFDLSSKSNARSQLGVLTLDGTGNKIFVRGNYVYVAIGSTANQLEIVQVSNNGSTLTKSSSISVAGQQAQDVYVDSAGDRAYIATSASSTQREMFIINTSSKSAPSLIGSYDANGMDPTGITVITKDNKAILVGTGGEEYQAIDISNEASPAHCGGLNIETGVKGVSSVVEADGDAYSYIVTGDASAELKIIEGGPGGSNIPTNWCTPQDAIVNTLTLPKIGNTISSNLGEVFIGTGDGTSGISFTDLAITTPVAPGNPTSSIISSFSNNSKTNGVYSDGNYAYLAVDGTTSQILILNISTTPFTQVGTISLPSNTNANGIFVSGNIAYVTSANKLYTFDVANKSGSHNTVLAQTDLHNGDGSSPIARQVTVVGGKAFVTASDTIYGLQVFKTGGGSSLKIVGVSDLPWRQKAKGLSVNSTGTRGYVAFDNGSGPVSKGYFAVDTSLQDPDDWWTHPNSYPIVAIYDSGSTDPTGIALAAGATNRVILTGSGGTYQYHTVDVSVDRNPLFCGGLNVPSGIKGISSILDAYNRGYSYIITGEASNQFKIIQGGTGGGNYKEDGTFESSIYTAGSNAAFNRLVANVIKPDKTTFRLQVASAPQVAGSCTNAVYSYVGPDGSSTSFYSHSGNTIAASIPFGNYSPNYQNPAQCFRYKTWFSTWDTAQTPIFNDITVNYSP